MSFKVFATASVFLVWASAAGAHEYDCCPHEHPLEDHLENTDCVTVGQVCEEGDDCADPGTCERRASFSRNWCSCLKTAPPSGGVCSVAGSNAFDPETPGLPVPGEVRVYVAAFESNNGWSVLFDEATVAEFEAADEALQGTVALEFGDFTDPTNVPVTLLDVALSLPSVTVMGLPSGPGLLRLRDDGIPVNLIYDAVDLLIKPVGGGGIPLAIDNDFGEGQGIRFWFEAGMTPDGRLLMYGQGEDLGMDLPEIPTLSQSSLLATTVLLLGAGVVVVRRQRHAVR